VYQFLNTMEGLQREELDEFLFGTTITVLNSTTKVSKKLSEEYRSNH